MPRGCWPVDWLEPPAEGALCTISHLVQQLVERVLAVRPGFSEDEFTRRIRQYLQGAVTALAHQQSAPQTAVHAELLFDAAVLLLDGADSTHRP